VRLGIPYIELDAQVTALGIVLLLIIQGRARPQIAELYNWRYKKLADLPVTKSEEYKLANAG
jgi:intron-binding protein aquarius